MADANDLPPTLKRGRGEDDLTELRAWLETTPLADAAPRRQELFQLEHAMTIAKALESFQAKRILSAPLVVAPDLEDLGEGGLDGADAADVEAATTPQLLGWVDTADILRAFFKHLHAHLAAEKKPLPTRMLELMTLLEKVGPSFAARPLITVTDGGDRALVYQAGPAHSLLDVMRDQFLPPPAPSASSQEGAAAAAAAHPPRVVHRVAIFDGSGAITAIVSQLDVMRFLLRHRSRLGSLAESSIADLGLLEGKPPVKTVDPHTPTLLALRDMLEAGVSGAAVCLPSGEMIANLSVSDVRAIQPAHLSALALPVCELLAVIHRTTYAGYSAGASKHAAHPFFQHRAGGGAGVASRGLRPPPGGSPTASAATAGTTATGTEGGGGGTVGGHEASSADATAPTSSRGPAAGTPPPPGPDEGEVRLITCTPDTPLAALLELFLAQGVHRVYVADNPDRPVPSAVVSPTDVMRLVSGVH